MPIASAQMRLAGYRSNLLANGIQPPNSGGIHAGGPGMLSPATTIVTASKTDSFSDPNGDGKAEAGDTVTYDVNISNTGASDATGVTFTDTIDANTTLVPGSLRVSPLAFADSYNATKDVALSISAPGVLTNDTGTPAPTAVAIAGGSTSQGGTVTLQSDGSFSYTPASGFTGTDTFTYTVTNGLLPDDTATVTINVDEGPTVTTTTPANGATNVASNTNITVNFSEPVNATTSSFSIECPTGSPQSFTLSASPASSFTLNPTTDLPAGANCTVTVIANQITDADSFDPPDQMAANYVFSFGTKLEAVDDMHSVTGNVRINTASSGFSVLSNDSPGVTVSAFDSTSANGGNVTMNTSTGTFTYDPPRGYTGTDSFNYTISNANGSDTATVVLTITDMLWFINNSAGACAPSSCGRLTSPYNSLSDFEADNGNGAGNPKAGDSIFIYTGSGNYTGPLTLENNQRVIGQGASSSIETLAGITLAPDSDPLPSTGGAKPSITSAGDGIVLAQNNQLYGIGFSNTTGNAVSGSAVGTLIFGDLAVNNTGSAGGGISLTGGGPVTSTGANTIATGTGVALNVANTTIDAGGLNFRSISANGAPSGIVLNNTGTVGGLTVTGNSSGICGGQVAPNATGTLATVTAPDTADCTGGTIQATTGAGISLTATKNTSLTRMRILNSGTDGINITNIDGFSLSNSYISDSGGTTSDKGIDIGNFTTGTTVNGSISIANSTIGPSPHDNVSVGIGSGTSSWSITGSVITGSATNSGLNFEVRNAASISSLNMSGNSVSGNFSNGFQIAPAAAATGSITATIQNNSFSNNTIGVNVNKNGTAATTYKVLNNTFIGQTGNAINAFTAAGAGTTGVFSARVTGNVIGNSGVANSGSASGIGIRVNINGGADAAVLIDSNTVRQTPNARGVEVVGRNGNGGLDVTVTNNNVDTQSAAGSSLAAIFVQSNCVSVCNTVRTDVRNNTVPSGATVDSNGTFIALVRTNTSTLQLVDTAPPDATCTSQLTANNTGSASASAACTLIAGPIDQAAAMFWPEASRREYLASADTAPRSDASGVQTLGTTNKTEWSMAHSLRTPKAVRSETQRAAAKTAVVNAAPAPSGETVTASIGTLPAGKTVKVQFQVTINDPLPNGVTQVSNQGTVSGSNFTSVQTDDPAAGGSSDPTVTPVLTPPDITVKDASVAEPSTGSGPAAFAVTLSHSFTKPVTVNFATAAGGANPATAGSDYTTTSGTLTFNPGQTVQTISVPVLADADGSETAENFLVNLSGATNGVITDGQATGTINPNGTPGTVLISELRTSGPGGADDDFVELLNNTDSDITVSGGWALVKSGGDCSETPVVIAVIPNGTVIPARGNYLLTGSAYSLGAYATGDQTLDLNIENDRNVALFNTADLSNIGTETRLDAVGFSTNTGNNCDLLREGATLAPASGSVSEYSFVRRVDKGETIDAGDNATDFVVVSTTPATIVGSNTTPTLGAPGPENATGARGPVPCSVPGTAKFGRERLDSSVGVGSAPNTVRDNTADAPNNSTYGTLDIRRKFTNNTGGSVTGLRFRIVDMTTTPASGTADLRARTSSTIVVGSDTVQGTTLETPPAQAQGGGVNSSLRAGTVTLLTPLANGSSINLRFLFGVEQQGDYRVGIVIETITSGGLGQDIWVLRGNTESGGHTDGGCNTPPVASAGDDQTVECSGGAASVALDGSASTDPDGDTPLTYEWREGATVIGTTAQLSTSLSFGPHTLTLKVTDPSGDYSEDTVNVNVVDTSDPLITAPPNVTVNTGAGATTCGAVVSDETLGTPEASDGCSTNVTVTRDGVPSGNNFPVGQTIITYTADDGHGHTKKAYQTVTVIDNTPPSLSVPSDQEVDAPANSCSASVNPGTASGSDNCGAVTITGVRSDSQPLNAPYPVGVTTITWTAKDGANNTTTGTQTIKVNDKTAPTIVLTSGTISLSPPNHQYVTFTISQLVSSVSDLCDASVDINDVVISQVTSDEPEDANGNGDGNTLNDMVITPDCKSLQVRKERSGNGDGRVYTVTLKVKDSSGNVATAVRKIYVPNSGPVIDSGATYTVNGCTP
ncbi:MAG TPA: Ig-like domain-containing protein [Pyrinomonadaceae bacterium]